MATKTALITEINANYPDNATGLITPAILRTTSTDQVNSWQQAPVVNAQGGTSYTVVVDDYGKLVVFNNAASVAVTLPQAVGGFATWNAIFKNEGIGLVTITPTTSTISGAASLSLKQNEFVQVVSDGVNYRATLNNVGSFVLKAGDTMTGPLVVTATGGNGIQVSGNTAGNPPSISAVGVDTNIGINYTTKGTVGGHAFYTNNFGTPQVLIQHQGVDGNYLVLQGGNGQNNISLNAALPVRILNPSLVGTPISVTPPTPDNSNKVATTAYVQANLAGITPAVWPPIVILATGQSNFGFNSAPLFNWSPSPNAFVWNWNETNGNVGTSFVPLSATRCNVTTRFASQVAQANPQRDVYLINISYGGQPIDQWLPGATSTPPTLIDVYQNILNNIGPALAAIGVSKIDIFKWWQGEANYQPPQGYIDKWNQVFARFSAETWWSEYVQAIIYGLASPATNPFTASSGVFFDAVSAQLQQLAQNDPQRRMYINSSSLPAAYWADGAHMTGAGYFQLGTIAASQFISGIGDNNNVDPLPATAGGGSLRASVIGRPEFRNLQIGGDFTTNPWQRGTTFTAFAGGFCADRFSYTNTSAAVVTVSKVADAPTIAQAGMFTQHCLDVNVTTADATVGAADLAVIGIARLEGRIVSFLGFGQTGARPITISFWIKSAKTGKYYVAVRNAPITRTYATSFIINAANIWERKTIQIPGDVTGTWPYDNAAMGLSINIVLMCGSNNFGTPDGWQGANFLCGSDQVNAVDTIGNHIKIALVQIEEGLQASAFEVLPMSMVMQRCQRYFVKSFNVDVAPVQNSSTLLGATFVFTPVVQNFGAMVEFPVRMRAAPTVTTYNPAAANANWRDTTVGGDCAVSVNASIGERGFSMVGIGGGAGSHCYIHWSATAD